MNITFGITGLPKECVGRVTLQTTQTMRDVNRNILQGLEVRAFPIEMPSIGHVMSDAFRKAAERQPEAMASILNMANGD